MVRHVAKEIGGSLPNANRGEMLGLQRGRLPLVLGIIGDAIEADFAVRPRLHAGPIDALRQILRLAQRPDVDDAKRATRAAAVDTDANIAVRHPFLRIDDLPVLIFVGRAGRHVRLVGAHSPPLIGVEIFEVQPLAVGPISHDHGIFAIGDRPVDVASQHQAVFHFDRHIPVDLHPVADFTFFTVFHGLLDVRFAVDNYRASAIRRPSPSNRWMRRRSKDSAMRSPALISAMPRPSVTATNARSTPASK
jgi:hypothetical protein